jgi:hypothetical protein
VVEPEHHRRSHRHLPALSAVHDETAAVEIKCRHNTKRSLGGDPTGRPYYTI